jgi:hypothetical protein
LSDFNEYEPTLKKESYLSINYTSNQPNSNENNSQSQ